MKYVLGQNYLFLHLASNIKMPSGCTGFENQTPDLQVKGVDMSVFRMSGDEVLREFTSIEFLELQCVEVRTSKDCFTGEEDCVGYIFQDSNGVEYAIQYPVASYSQTSDLGDYLASKYFPEGYKSANPDVDYKQFILFSYWCSDLMRPLEHHTLLENRQIDVKFFKDFVGQIEQGVKNPVPDKEIKVDILSALSDTRKLVLEKLPAGWEVQYITKNHYREDGTSFLFRTVKVVESELKVKK